AIGKARDAQRPLEPAYARSVDRLHQRHMGRGAHRAACEAGLFHLAAPRSALAGIEGSAAGATEQCRKAPSHRQADDEIRDPRPHGRYLAAKGLNKLSMGLNHWPKTSARDLAECPVR